jgi:peptide/nickel transport system ATP-binding protein
LGSVRFDDEELLALPEKRMADLRGNDISMIFQDPMTALYPLKTVSVQLEGAIKNHLNVTRAEARERIRVLLERVGLSSCGRYAEHYPFELSGGMQQRVIIAQAIACNPKFVIADEPTTALDVTIQAQILALLLDLQREYGMSMLLVTHNFGVVSQICDRVSVMYAGRIVETAAKAELLSAPMHPYTRALINCIPKGKGRRESRLFALPGSPPSLYEREEACPFRLRCKYADSVCNTMPAPVKYGEHVISCHHALLPSGAGAGI